MVSNGDMQLIAGHTTCWIQGCLTHFVFTADILTRDDVFGRYDFWMPETRGTGSGHW